MTSQPTLRECLTFLAQFYGGSKPTNETVAAWAAATWDTEDDVFREACLEFSRTPGKRFFPTPGELLAVPEKWLEGWEPAIKLPRAVEVAHGKTAAELDPGLRAIIALFGPDRFRAIAGGERPTPGDERAWTQAARRQKLGVIARKAQLAREGPAALSAAKHKEIAE